MLVLLLIFIILIGYGFIARFMYKFLHIKGLGKGPCGEVDQDLLSLLWPISAPFYCGIWLADCLSWFISLIRHGLRERGPMDE